MRLVVAAVGRLRTGPERDLTERFRARAAKAGRQVGIRAVEIIEIRDSRAAAVDKRVLEESIALANVIPDGAMTVVLDQQGENLDSASLTGHIRAWRDCGRGVAVFVIGGADGLTSEIKKQADLRLALGAATWPHELVRIMLLEQLYRTVTILSGHPYHRGAR